MPTERLLRTPEGRAQRSGLSRGWLEAIEGLKALVQWCNFENPLFEEDEYASDISGG